MCSNFCDIKPTTQWYSLEYGVMYNFFHLLCSLLPRYSGQHLFFHPIVSEAASPTCNRFRFLLSGCVVSSFVAARGLSLAWLTGSRARLSSRGTWLHPPMHLGSSWMRDRTCVPCIDRWVLNRRTTQEVQV